MEKRPPELWFPPWVRSVVPANPTTRTGAGESEGWSRRAASPRKSSHRRRRSRRDPDHRSSSRRRRRRGAREEPRRSRSPVTEVGRHGRTSSLPGESVPVLELGRTSGVTSAGAWAARLEMANLLEARCDPTTLIKLAREGTEGDHPLDMSGKLKLIPQASFKVERVSEISERSKLSLDLGDSDEASSMGRGGESSRASMRSATEKRPEWAHPVVEKSTAPEKTYFSSIPQGLSFAKPAFPKGTKPEEKSKDGSHQDRRVEEEEVRESFAKVAKPPPRKERVLPGVPTATIGGKTAPKSMGEKESKDLARYHELSLSIFNKLRVLGVEMDLLDLVKREDGSINGDRFSIHTSPNRASTGLRYARLMMNLLVWGERDERPLPEDSVPCNKLSVLDYVESIIQEGCGCHTPHAVLLAWDFYGKAFGFTPHGGHFGRAKRLASKCTSQAVGGRVGAPLFSKEVMNALECMVLDPFLNLGARVAAGKLRLCIQSSTRYDDVLNTPLKAWEWVRKRGELEIVGIRSKAVRGKNRPRLWIASTMGVTPSGDTWLKTLVDLLLRMHGEDWRQDDHTGKLVSRDGKKVYQSPARMDADVSILKATLLDNLGVSGSIGVKASEIESMRWHGAKATLVTVMQHLNISPRVVRFVGDWGSKDESMADLYLREAQLMTLSAQQDALKFLRLGGSVVGLEGQGIATNPTTQDGESLNLDETVESMAKMDEVCMKPADVAEVLFDNVFTDGLPDLARVEEEKIRDTKVQEGAEKLLFKGFEDEDDDESDSEDSAQLEASGSKADGGMNPPLENVEADGDRAPSESGDPVDESLVGHFVQVLKPTKLSKLHMALPAHRLAALGSAKPLPKCGARGDYAEVSASEKLSAGLCVRCFGSGKCDHLCEHVKVDEAGTGHVRCARRCSHDGDHAVHLCVFHSDD